MLEGELLGWIYQQSNHHFSRGREELRAFEGKVQVLTGKMVSLLGETSQLPGVAASKVINNIMGMVLLAGLCGLTAGGERKIHLQSSTYYEIEGKAISDF